VRRFLNPKALALGAVALVLMAAMVSLGFWQLSVYDDQQHADAQSALREPTVPLDTLIGPDDAFPSDGVSRPVRASGTYLARDQLYVRHLAGSTGRYAVATPLVTATGSAILVVRGSTASPSAEVPSGRITVRGILEPSGGVGSPPDASGLTNGLSIASLVNAVGPDLYSGYVLLRSSTPPETPALVPVTPPSPNPSPWSGVRNLLYACQWWVFALFVAFMWWRMTDELTPDKPLQA